ncbi:hypothetical protein D3C76_1447380 [compost metagenome]
MALVVAVRPLRRATQHGIDACDHLFRDKRFGHIVIGTPVKSSQPVFDAVSGRQHDDGTAAFAADLLQQFEAI